MVSWNDRPRRRIRDKRTTLVHYSLNVLNGAFDHAVLCEGTGGHGLPNNVVEYDVEGSVTCLRCAADA